LPDLRCKPLPFEIKLLALIDGLLANLDGLGKELEELGIYGH
jgi:hypothetical protein